MGATIPFPLDGGVSGDISVDTIDLGAEPLTLQTDGFNTLSIKNGANTNMLLNGGFTGQSNATIGFSSGTNVFAPGDTTLSRISAGAMGVGTGLSGETDGELHCAAVQLDDAGSIKDASGHIRILVEDANHIQFREAGGANVYMRVMGSGSKVQLENNIVLQFGATANYPTVQSGSGTPESSVSAGVGSLYLRVDGGTGTSLYVKESGTGNTGWAAV